MPVDFMEMAKRFLVHLSKDKNYCVLGEKDSRKLSPFRYEDVQTVAAMLQHAFFIPGQTNEEAIDNT